MPLRSLPLDNPVFQLAVAIIVDSFERGSVSGGHSRGQHYDYKRDLQSYQPSAQEYLDASSA